MLFRKFLFDFRFRDGCGCCVGKVDTNVALVVKLPLVAEEEAEAEVSSDATCVAVYPFGL